MKALKSEPAVRSSTAVREPLDSFGLAMFMTKLQWAKSVGLARISRANQSRAPLVS
jgi:hypothetical protein